MWLLHEKLLGVNSTWYHYIRTLPTAFSTPTEFDDREIQDLEGTQLRMYAIERKKFELNEFQWIKKVVSSCRPSMKFQWHDWHWARTIVTTRAFSYDMQNELENKTVVKDICLVPFIEMANHAFVNVSWFTYGKKFYLYSEDPIAAGSQFHINYGSAMSNLELLKHYGFVVEHNHNAIPTDCENDDCKCIYNKRFNTTVLEEELALESSALSFNSRNAKRVQMEVIHGLDLQAANCKQPHVASNAMQPMEDLHAKK